MLCLHLSLVFLVVGGVIAAVLGFGGIAGSAARHRPSFPGPSLMLPDLIFLRVSHAG